MDADTQGLQGARTKKVSSTRKEGGRAWEGVTHSGTAAPGCVAEGPWHALVFRTDCGRPGSSSIRALS